MAHQKQTGTVTIPGGVLQSGSRKVVIKGVSDDVLECEITLKKGESVVIKDPSERDPGPWIKDDPGEGSMVTVTHYVPVGHKVRIGSFRQFRVLTVNGNEAVYSIVGPDSES